MTVVPSPDVWEFLYFNLWQETYAYHHKNKTRRNVMLALSHSYRMKTDFVSDFIESRWAALISAVPEAALMETWASKETNMARAYVCKAFSNYCIDCVRKSKLSIETVNIAELADEELPSYEMPEPSIDSGKACLYLEKQNKPLDNIVMQWRLDDIGTEEACEKAGCSRAMLYKHYYKAMRKWCSLLQPVT